MFAPIDRQEDSGRSSFRRRNKMLKNRLATVLGLLVMAGLIVSACTPTGGQTVVQTQIVTQESVVTATPEAGAKVLRINISTYPDLIDPQKSSFVNEIAHLKLM